MLIAFSTFHLSTVESHCSVPQNRFRTGNRDKQLHRDLNGSECKQMQMGNPLGLLTILALVTRILSWWPVLVGCFWFDQFYRFICSSCQDLFKRDAPSWLCCSRCWSDLWCSLALSLSVCFSKRIMDAGWFCWIISLNTTGTRTIFSTRAYTKWYKHSLHIPEMPTIAHLCEFHDLPSWMLGHSAATCCNFEIFQNDLEDFKTIRTCSSFENAFGILWHPTTCEVQGPLTPASLDKRPVETGLAVEQPRMAPTKPLIRKTLAEDDTDTTDDTVDSSTS